MIPLPFPLPEEGALTRPPAAQGALARGLARAAADPLAALAMLEYAQRLAPADGVITRAIGVLRLQQGDPRAAEAFELLAARDACRAGFLGLAAARLASGLAAAAAAELARALQRHAPPQDAAFAAAVVRAAEAPGWCGLTAAGLLSVAPARRGRLVVALDGRPVTLSGAGGVLGAALPRDWRAARRVDALLDGRPLLGSPIDLRAIARLEGVIEAAAEGLQGWAWHPADPATAPALALRALDLRATPLHIRPDAPAGGAAPFGARAVALDRAALGALTGLLAVTGPDGRHLLGSPLEPGAASRAAAAAAALVRHRTGARDAGAPPALPALVPVPADLIGPPPAAPQLRPGTAIVIPVHRGLRLTLDCIDAVLATTDVETAVIVVDDASPEPALARALDELARRHPSRLRLIRLGENRGFPAAANAGLRAAAGRDAVLLNSDTRVTEGWLDRLRAAAYSAPEIGTASPLSNDATILSYPCADGNPPPGPEECARLARLAAAANRAATVEIPTAVGFCMFIRHDCLERTGLLREDLFAQGYGEENDFCLRARHLGFRHVAVPGAYVAHIGGASFGAARAHLMRRNLAVLNRLHPGWDALIAAHRAADPLAPARRRLDEARWRDGRQGAAVLLVSHDGGGGVERQVAARCAALRAAGRRPIVIRPAPGGCRLSDGVADAFPNLLYRLPEEAEALVRLLRADRPVLLELHHLLGHDHAILDLAGALDIPHEVHVHDYLWFCPRIALLGRDRRYCGEPEVTTCESCVADLGSNLEEPIGVGALRTRSARDLGSARRVVAPTVDAAWRLRRHFPALRPEIHPWEDDGAIAAPPPLPAGAGHRRVCIPGAIGLEKGYEVLLACARDAALRDLPLDFVVAGFTMDDERLLATGRVFVTGRYEEVEGEALLRAQRADLAFIPSVWPETWCFALTLAWRAGLRAAVFDLGAPAERVRHSGWGWTIPLGLPADGINNTLLALATPPARVAPRADSPLSHGPALAAQPA